MRWECSEGVVSLGEEAGGLSEEPVAPGSTSLLHDLEGVLQQVLKHGQESPNILSGDIPAPPPRQTGIAH